MRVALIARPEQRTGDVFGERETRLNRQSMEIAVPDVRRDTVVAAIADRLPRSDHAPLRERAPVVDRHVGQRTLRQSGGVHVNELRQVNRMRALVGDLRAPVARQAMLDARRPLMHLRHRIVSRHEAERCARIGVRLWNRRRTRHRELPVHRKARCRFVGGGDRLVPQPERTHRRADVGELVRVAVAVVVDAVPGAENGGGGHLIGQARARREVARRGGVGFAGNAGVERR